MASSDLGDFPTLGEFVMGSLSPVHWLIVIVVVLLMFGPGRLAGVGKGLGEGIRSFKKGLNEDADPPTDAEKQLADKAADKSAQNKPAS
ncbi:MAG TPA: twin-arginine translocase TatA/TatE family subunit [Polyangiaceae bacterium]|nr:twin-arginine translocase TatA/TatE family subunit [Polyangiaceae bacterium]